MAETLRLFVSATNDLEAERAVIGRLVAELPVQIRVEIRRCALLGTSYETMHELISNVDRVYFLFGQDITAPAGQEWHLAWQLERSLLPLRKPGRLTPAGQQFLSNAPLRWTLFRDAQELGRIVTRDLIQILQHPTNRYGLSVTEMELLEMRRRQLGQLKTETGSEPGGAEGGGILLDTQRLDPMDGTVIE